MFSVIDTIKNTLFVRFINKEEEMNDKILNQIAELNSLLENKYNEECKIIFENPDEAELVGNINSYLHLLSKITKLILTKNTAQKGVVTSYDIKECFDEFGDCWIVNAKVTD